LLKITVQKGSGSSTLKLEGKLAGPWVGELKEVWRSESATEAVLVDLLDVSFVDAAGKDLLAQMWQGRADFVADSPLMKQVIEEVTGSPEGWGNPARLTRCVYTSKGEKP
jgi:ABC-type transporter Mla MlaB component